MTNNDIWGDVDEKLDQGDYISAFGVLSDAHKITDSALEHVSIDHSTARRTLMAIRASALDSDRTDIVTKISELLPSIPKEDEDIDRESSPE